MATDGLRDIRSQRVPTMRRHSTLPHTERKHCPPADGVPTRSVQNTVLDVELHQRENASPARGAIEQVLQARGALLVAVLDVQVGLGPTAEPPYRFMVVARDIGEVVSRKGPGVILKSLLGTERVLDMLSGEQLPRIC